MDFFRLSVVLSLTATCLLLTEVVDSVTQVTTCDSNQWQVHRLFCGPGVISMQQALYGRSSSGVCADGQDQKQLTNTLCARENTMDNIKTSCNGKHLCELSMDDFRAPDPCVGTSKYLQTNFTCLPAVTVVACEASVAHLYCDMGHVIFVYGADYGRRDRTTCAYRRSPQEIDNVGCLHPTDIVSKRCNGQTSCMITASNDLFGDPCVGTYKYLEVTYTCQWSSSNAHQCCGPVPAIIMASYFRRSSALLLIATCWLLPAVVDSALQVTTCDFNNWQVHRLDCGHGVISVSDALYGRASSLVCSEGRPPQELADTRCAQGDAVERLKRSCNGKKSCEVTVEDFRTPDPCVGTFKYLQTNFTCVSAFTVVACELSVAQLYCDWGRVIFVYGADYGRRDQTTCTHGRSRHEIENVECLQPTDVVANRCNGKNTCTITASNAVFGDPCKGTYKYLEVAYTCNYRDNKPY
ncbi:L-rhamnose-binding lectin CSL1-like [Syngnathoides biaculeatus]|uniref:L-rhamnose-binding lectin CSL1-like n=1 Tax=Syngnathoides biaculeatus TaxID=300417 RepID=UPI002ADE4D2B|nr:L-rhamnose-binding lectin CSL1-like [Syngnathoides biaculeatus]